MSYALSKNTWTYKYEATVEEYGGPVTLPLNEWQKYVASGKHILYGSGGIIPGGTTTTAFGNSGSVYKGLVRQGY